jgi:stress response protein YsnF
LNNTLLNDQRVIGEIRKEIKNFPEFNEKENTICHNLWDTAKEVLRGKFLAMSVYIKNTERSEINGLMLHIKLSNKNKLNPKEA